MNNPLVSIIVPIYKVEDYLDQCIESIVNQTYANLEILLIDDGSPDNCGIICDRWAEKDGRIQVVHKQNGGLSNARNTGLELASGDYLMMPDGDDYLLPDAVQTMVQYAQVHQAQCILGGFQRLFPDGSLHPLINCTNPVICTNRKEIEHLILLPMIGAEYRNIQPLSQSACIKLYCRHFIEVHNLRFLPTYEIGSEDFYFNMQFFSQADRAVIIPENNYIYRYNDHSITTTFHPERVNCLIRLYHLMQEEQLLVGSSECRQMLASNILGNISVHVKQIAAASSPHKISAVRQVMDDPSVRKMLSECQISKIRFPLNLFCLLMKFKMTYMLFILIRLFLLLN